MQVHCSYILHRLQAAPEFTIVEWPPAVQVPSKRNTPVEGFWRWIRQGEGHNIRDAILVGKTDGLFNANNELHVQVLHHSSKLLRSSHLADLNYTIQEII
jgi:hypothetical protein